MRCMEPPRTFWAKPDQARRVEVHRSEQIVFESEPSDKHHVLARKPMCNTKKKCSSKRAKLRFQWEAATVREVVRTEDQCSQQNAPLHRRHGHGNWCCSHNSRHRELMWQQQAGSRGGGKTGPTPIKPHATGRRGATSTSPTTFAFAPTLALPPGLTAPSSGAALRFASTLGFATAGGRGAYATRSDKGALQRTSPIALAAPLPFAAPGPSIREHATKLYQDGVVRLQTPRHRDGSAVEPEKHGSTRETNDSHESAETTNLPERAASDECRCGVRTVQS